MASTQSQGEPLSPLGWVWGIQAFEFPGSPGPLGDGETESCQLNPAQGESSGSILQAALSALIHAVSIYWTLF